MSFSVKSTHIFTKNIGSNPAPKCNTMYTSDKNNSQSHAIRTTPTAMEDYH